ncbi:4Fe-4S dicluster domain-containing protein [Blastochloris sulfoviridis]|uniref:Disulfide reductase n=1 Tax=Blastochloris sulfoviridis TaxID=50712 RepID=A0A5M6HVI8_9HYPH|nr:4Fe-4S dicluster domain-containing protein [Blastochloris sulfoviridis]KAA5599923.1 disulfide reductase [Blastochloris sulfoviridis]NJL07084.1 disulfide reductase [Candidatus Methylacidiphilales bacterium]
MSVKIDGNGAEARAFIEKVESLSNQDLLACYQCGKCSAGCPMAKYMDLLPHQMIRFAQLGLKDELLGSEAIWMCVSCLTCNTRCPKGVRIAEVIEALRQLRMRDKRNDHLHVHELSASALAKLPPIAVIGSMRKGTS